MEAVYVVDGPKMRGVLLANQDADLAERFRLFEVGDFFYALELLVRRDECVPPGNVSQRLRVDVPRGVPDGGVEHRNSRISQPDKIGLPELPWIGFPDRQFPVVQSQQAQHVDQDRKSTRLNS